MTEEVDLGGDDSADALSTVADAVADIVTGVPAPIRKNALKAFGRLCTAAVEYPVALIDNAIAERRAESRARIKLIEISGNQIAERMHTDPEYARAAVKKFGEKLLRERVNVDQIAGVALNELKSAPPVPPDPSGQEIPPVNDDWLNAFENEASQMTTEQMQRLFGKILAGEIRRPSSYSIKTVKLMAQLDNRAAALFRLLCSLSISLPIPMTNQVLDARVVSLGGNAGSNVLGPFGLGFDALNILHEYGLIISDYNSYMDYRVAVANGASVGLPFVYQGSKWGLVPKTTSGPMAAYQVHGVGFSQCGKEMLSIVDTEPNEPYTTALKKFFMDHGMTMTPVG